VGPTPTLPPHQQPLPTSRDRHAQRPDPDGDLVFGVDQPSTTPAALAAERERDGDLALEEAVTLHRELAEADPTIRTAEAPKPLGRRLPEPLDAGREGVER
jgi:hypothetical protein